jgi:hypothetical protein
MKGDKKSWGKQTSRKQTKKSRNPSFSKRKRFAYSEKLSAEQVDQLSL